MTQATTQSTSTADAVNHLVDKIGDGLGQITAAISSHAPQAWELVVRGNFARAVADAVMGSAELVIAVTLALTAASLFRAGNKIAVARNGNEFHRGDTGERFFVGGAAISFIAVIFAIGGLYDASQAIPMLISPEGVTARDLLLRAL